MNKRQAVTDPETETKFELEPLGDQVIVKPHEAADVSKGGIILLEGSKEQPNRGTVVATGPGRYTEEGRLVPLEVSKGDEVIYKKYAGTDVKFANERLVILRERDLLTRVRPKS